MKTITTAIITLLQTAIVYGQPKIIFDTTVFDCGQIIHGHMFKKDLRFTNTGAAPLVIENAATSDGGSMVEYSREPVMPGRSGIITFHYNSAVAGIFEKYITLSSNAQNDGMWRALRVKGEVVWPRTSIKTNLREKNIGTLRLGEVDTITFKIANTGEKDLRINFDHESYPESDLLYCRIQSKDSIDKEYRYYMGGTAYSPGETVTVTMLLKNRYGHTGRFERRLYFVYNSHDTFLFTIKGRFTGAPRKKAVYEGSSILHYQNNQLAKREYYGYDGKLYREDFFSGSYCTRSVRYHWKKKEATSICFYKQGRLVKREQYQVDIY